MPVDLIRTGSRTCYVGDRTNLHKWGYGCGECPACDLGSGGWETVTSA
ncbi:7-cyano-7-deazaguanine synthase [Pseudomonas sp. GX19020]|nr:7-cyano-7-deazaguanine synthase [Pseudomonas sp. GX19020]MCL4068956.1 7-cyano-7-deazaguanine synthase [Pseudomonas sp. GX19020]